MCVHVRLRVVFSILILKINSNKQPENQIIIDSFKYYSPDMQAEKQSTFSSAYDFIQKSRAALKDQRTQEIQQFKQVMTSNSTKELQAMGLVLNNLRLKSTKSGLYGRTLLTLAHPFYSKAAVESQKDITGLRLPDSKFGAGDNVCIYEQDDFLRDKPIFEGIVHRRTEFKITISLELKEDESEEDIQGKSVFVCCSINEVTYNRYQKALQELETAAKDHMHPSARVINTLFNNRKYHSVAESQLTKGVQQKLQASTLNSQQAEAVRKSLCTESVHLIHGPPGTGKTKTVCEIIGLAVTQKNLKVLACAGSNIAVDNMVERVHAKWGKSVKCCRLGHPSRMIETVEQHCLDSLISKTSSFKLLREQKQKYQQLKTKFVKTKEKAAKKELKQEITAARSQMRNHQQVAIEEVLSQANVTFCTNAGAGDRIFKRELQKTIFDLVIIDECAQAVEVSCWLPLLKGRKAILAGDHKQLPPTIKSKKSAKLLSYTLFDRAMEQCQVQSTLLTIQYRMNNQIMVWSSQNFYQDQLVADKSVKDHTVFELAVASEQALSKVPLLLVDTSGCKMGENYTEANDTSKSKFNLGEADIVKVLLEELLQHGLRKQHLGVITPYNAQVNQIKQLIQDLEVPAQQPTKRDDTVIEVSTVDGFQGREKEVIIISMVRSNPLKNVGFLADYRRMNVAVTRARRLVMLVGDCDTVTADSMLKTLVQYFREHGQVRSGQDFREDDRVRFGLGFIAHEGTQQQQSQPQQPKKQKKKKQNKDKHSAKDSQIKQLTDAEIQRKIEKVVINQDANQSAFGDLHKLSDLQARFRVIVDKFLQSPDQQYVFHRLNPAERKVVHIIAENIGLQHTTSQDKTLLTIAKGANKQEAPIRQLAAEQMDEIDKLVKVFITNKALTKQTLPSKDKAVINYINHICRNNGLQTQPDPATNQVTIVRPKQKKPAPQKPKPAQQPSKPNNKEKKRGPADQQMTQQDELQFLDGMIEDQKRCHYKAKECKAKVTYLGLRCKFCNEVFCQQHLLAELHGCGKQAHVHAHQEFVEAVNKQKDLSAKDRNYLEYQLNNKIKKQQEKRAPQPKKKQK